MKLIKYTIVLLQKALPDKWRPAPPPPRYEIIMYDGVTLGGTEQLPETTSLSEPLGLRDAARTWRVSYPPINQAVGLDY